MKTQKNSEKVIRKNYLKNNLTGYKNFIFVWDEVYKQPLKTEGIYRVATKTTKFGSKPVEPKTNLS